MRFSAVATADTAASSLALVKATCCLWASSSMRREATAAFREVISSSAADAASAGDKPGPALLLLAGLRTPAAEEGVGVGTDGRGDLPEGAARPRGGCAGPEVARAAREGGEEADAGISPQHTSGEERVSEENWWWGEADRVIKSQVGGVGFGTPLQRPHGTQMK